MEVFQAVVLGAVQGLTEFLPVSSSGHLIVFPALFHWKDQGLAFDALVHFGTFVALLWYFKKDIAKLIKDLLAKKKTAVNFTLRLAVATVPALLLALIFDSLIERYLRSTFVVAASLIFWGLVLLLADRWSAARETRLDAYQEISWKQALIVGLMQPLALIPGTSRSGITMTAGLFAGLGRRAAAQFSFFLAIPVTGLAGIYGIWKSLSEPGVYAGLSLWAGFLSAAAFGLFAIHFLLNYLKKRKYDAFVIYRVILALFLIAFL